MEGDEYISLGLIFSWGVPGGLCDSDHLLLTYSPCPDFFASAAIMCYNGNRAHNTLGYLLQPSAVWASLNVSSVNVTMSDKTLRKESGKTGWRSTMWLCNAARNKSCAMMRQSAKTRWNDNEIMILQHVPFIEQWVQGFDEVFQILNMVMLS